MMVEKSVAVLKETRANEKRVILLPEEVQKFCKDDFRVFVETGAGAGTGVTDDDYRVAGGEIVSTEDAWQLSPYVLKYKAPGPEEFGYLREDLHLGAFFHAEGNEHLTEELCRQGVSAYTYEFFQTPEGVFPLAVPDTEISGKLAVLYGAYYLQSHLGGRGMLLADTIGAKPPRVLVIGYGNAGGAASRLASSMGAKVAVLGTNRERLRQFQATMPSSVECYLNSPEILAREVQEADLVIGAILISTYDTEPMITEDLLESMKAGTVIVDVTVGYGSGYLPTFDRQTTHDDPMYERSGVLHCKIDAMPGSVPLTATQAVSPLVTPYLIELGNAIFEGTDDPTSKAGQIVDRGKIAHPEIQRHMDMISAMES